MAPVSVESVNQKLTVEKSQKAQFGLVLNWAFVTQSSMKAVIIEVANIPVQQFGDILRMTQIEIEIKLVLNPAIQCLNNRIVCWSSASRHGTQYVILTMGLAKSLGRVDNSLVGVEDYLGLLLFFFACKAIQNCKAIVIRLVVAGNVCDAVGKDLVIEGVQ